jgi:hypothetical protein
MSAFLKFSQSRRPKVKEENPDMGNTDVSRLLGEMWRNASAAEKAPYREEEEKERAVYKEEVKRFREKQSRLDAANRSTHHSAVQDYQQQQKPHSQRSSPSYESHISSTPPDGGFENLGFDSLIEDQSSKRSAFRSQSNTNSYQRSLYHSSEYYSLESYPAWSPLDIDDPDPLPVVPSRMPPPAMQMSRPNNEDYNNGSAYYSSRSSYFSDPFNLPHFSHYP